MKNLILVSAILSAFCSFSASAADFGTIDSSATVLGECKFIDRTFELDFGVIKPGFRQLTEAELRRDATLRFECTKGVQANVSIPTQGPLVSDSGSAIQYTVRNADNSPFGSVYTVTGEGFGNATPLTYNVNGRLDANSIKTARPGLYSRIGIVEIVN